MTTNIVDIILDLPLKGERECKSATEKLLAHGPMMFYILESLKVPYDVIEQVTSELPKTPREFFNLTIEDRLAWAAKVAPSADPVVLTSKVEYAVRSFVGNAVENYWLDIGCRFKRP